MMRNLIPQYLVIALSFYASVSFGSPLEGLSLVNGCRVMDSSGAPLATFPGNQCLFNPDGSFISATNKGLEKFNKANESQWFIPGHFHHQMNFSLTGKSILALASEVIDGKGEKLRLDKFYVINQEGKILHQQLAAELFRQAGVKLKKFESEPALLALTGAKSESSHFNSFYEIPALIQLKDNGRSSPKYVVNSLTSGVFFLTEDLQRVTKHLTLAPSEQHQIHDVQLLENGNLFYFNNLVKGSRPDFQSSAIQELDLESGKVISEFSAEPKTFFFSRFGGSAQRLSQDQWLFTDMLTATHIYDHKKKKLIASINKTHAWEGRPFGIPTFQVKAVDLREFFKARKPLP